MGAKASIYQKIESLKLWKTQLKNTDTANKVKKEIKKK